MRCARPFRRDGQEFGCNRCLACGVNRARMWTIRLVLESLEHQASCFLTLTKEDRDGSATALGCVSVRESQLFLKRLRQDVGPFRYFIVGEYGDRTFRPHYHAALFGVRDAEAIHRAWGLGFVHLSGIGFESARYLAGYACKRMTRMADRRLGGRCPEFARMSLRPGIGAWNADRMSGFYSSKDGALVLSCTGDVSGVVRQSHKLWPLGRYLTARVRESSGVSNEVLRACQRLAFLERLQKDLPAVQEEWRVKEANKLASLRSLEFREKQRLLNRRGAL